MRIITATVAAAAVVGSAAAYAASPHGGAGAPAPAVAASVRTLDGTALPARQFARARVATARFATNLEAAKRAGYQILTREIPGMGFHFINPKIAKFDVTTPPILVYEHTGKHRWQLAALEWAFPAKPKTPPLAGAKYGSFPAACHYADGTFIPKASQAMCPKTDDHGAKFTLWHPDLVTLHVWLWYPNPSGIYASFNPLVSPFH
jgi:hypothetical protein